MVLECVADAVLVLMVKQNLYALMGQSLMRQELILIIFLQEGKVLQELNTNINVGLG